MPLSGVIAARHILPFRQCIRGDRNLPGRLIAEMS